MDIKIKVWLLDIQDSIDEIYEFLGENRNFFSYRKDLKTKKAVERNLEIISGAVKRILKMDQKFSLKDAKNIIGTRPDFCAYLEALTQHNRFFPVFLGRFAIVYLDTPKAYF